MWLPAFSCLHNLVRRFKMYIPESTLFRTLAILRNTVQLHERWGLWKLGKSEAHLIAWSVTYLCRKQEFVNEGSFRMFKKNVKHDWWYFILLVVYTRIVYLRGYLSTSSKAPVHDERFSISFYYFLISFLLVLWEFFWAISFSFILITKRVVASTLSTL